MANPGGRAPPNRTNDFAPLHPRHHLNPADDHRRTRDLQVWPRSMRETHDRQELRRTAAIKHHLRKEANRGEMLTTYEHDFGVTVRNNPKGSTTGFGASFYGTGGQRPPRRMAVSCPVSPTRMSAPKLLESGYSSDDDDARSIRSGISGRCRSLGDLGATARDPGATLGYSTMSKMNCMVANGKPMRLTVSGWGEQIWSPKSHPHMIVGFSDRRCNLEQTAKIMNTRAADVPFSTR